ncbi:MAG: hypothetical protein HZB23_03475 [Deltaproteobacteria bacterium]|nr:hypothetical protein [Deltaproteobacteria bacterium]
MSQISVENDIAELVKLSSQEEGRIKSILQTEKPQREILENEIPGFFFRLLFIYKLIIDNGGIDNLEKATIPTVMPLFKWINDKLPNVLSMPGFNEVLAYAEKVHSPKIRNDLNANATREKIIAQKMGSTTTMHAIELLNWKYTPTLRIFFMNEDEILFDSHNGWGEWLYVAGSIIKFISNHAERLNGLIPVWASLQQNILQDNIQNLKNELEIFESVLKANSAPQPIEPPKSKRRKRKADQSKRVGR